MEDKDYKKLYEEAIAKAKAYDKAIERAKEINREHSKKGFNPSDDVLYVFPELRESEDEKIRKELLNAFQESEDSLYLVLTPHRRESFIAWLKKQGNTNEIINRDEFAQGVLRGAAINLITWIDYHAAEGNMCLSSMECKDIEDALVSGDWNKIYTYMKKKPENQVEPKFHEGDILKHNKANIIRKVLSANIGFYSLADMSGSNKIKLSNVEKNFHLWTIKDAKCGDVLADGNLPFIFKKIDANKYIYAYCGISVDDGFKIESDGESGEWTWMQDMKPATKEQRDTLMRVMADAGYTFDFKKKMLKKIEQKPVNEVLEQNHDWSEDNEYHVKSILSTIECCKAQFPNSQAEVEAYNADIDWLKSLKDRVQPLPKQEWSEEDENMLNEIILDLKVLRDRDSGEAGKAAYQREINWLKSLKVEMQYHKDIEDAYKAGFELGLKAQKIQDEIKIGETEIYLEDDGGEPPYDGIQWLDLSCMEYEIPKDKFKDGDNVEIIIRKAQKGE